MNNNKKYKKWSLGLVAPALVLAPIAVVASCSSSGEEKLAYGVTFTNNDKIKATIHKAVNPTALTDVQFKEEVLAHKSDLFAIEGTLPSDNFLNDNIEISGLDASDDAKTVSAKVKLNKANTSGESIEKTITLTGLGYEEVTLTDLKYKIAFKEIQQDIQLTDQENISVATLTAEKLIDLVLTTDNKAKILDITGNDAAKITDEVLANQILKVTELKPAATEGKITFKLSVEKPENGAGNTLDKEITFAGFKQETDSTPTTEYVIVLGDKGDDDKYELKTVANKTTEEFSTTDAIKELIIQEKSVIFKAAKGELPGEKSWWDEKLQVNNPSADLGKGEITVEIQLSNSDSSDDSQNINETITLKGFLPKETIPTTGDVTTPKTPDVSTVTLGLNGSLTELKSEVNEQWIFEKKKLLFQKGFEPITQDGISQVKHEPIKNNNGSFDLKFTLAENNYYDDNGDLATTAKEFTVRIKGISSSATTGVKLKYKSGTNPLSIGLVDPELAESGTYEQFRDNSADVFNKEFVFKYRKHLLTGDFSKVDQAGENGFLEQYPEDSSTQPPTPATFVKIIPDDSTKTIQIKFKILKEKLVPEPAANEEYSITFKEFKTT